MSLQGRIYARRHTLIILLSLMLVLALWYMHPPFAQLYQKSDALAHRVRDLGVLAPLAFVLLYALQIVIAPIPGGPITLAGGYLFGPFWGTIYSLVGIALGAVCAALLARRLGRPPLERWIGAERLRYWEERLHARSPVTWVVFFFHPISDLGYYAAGLSNAPLGWLMLAACLGRAPTLIAENWIGSHVVLLPFERIWHLVLLLLVPCLILYFRRRDIAQRIRRAARYMSYRVTGG